jgi:hypothetical protein
MAIRNRSGDERNFKINIKRIFIRLIKTHLMGVKIPCDGSSDGKHDPVDGAFRKRFKKLNPRP